jgi:glycosyltransferase involved in cell wall biosynthesis
MKITFFIDDKLGGVSSLNYNLIRNRPDDFFEHEVVHIRLLESDMTRSNLSYPKAKNIIFSFSLKDNLYRVLKRLGTIINRAQEGILVLNYYTEMAMLDHYPVKQTIFQLVHDDYNIDLAKKYGHVVDVFICHNTVINQKLINLLPERVENIFYLPHGVSIPSIWRNQRGRSTDPIKLLFIGRMVSSKGIFDLPVINDLLRKNGVAFEWTCIGSGPELDKLKQVWNPLDKVRFLSPSTSEEVISISAEQDVFVLPTKFEGSPVSLLEAMSVGLVPVVSKIPGGITDIINAENGFTVEVDDHESFAKAIMSLNADRFLMNKLSTNARAKIEKEFDIKNTAKNYYDLFRRFDEFYRDKKIKNIPVGARLDHPLIPSPFTKFARIIMGRNG